MVRGTESGRLLAGPEAEPGIAHEPRAKGTLTSQNSRRLTPHNVAPESSIMCSRGTSAAAVGPTWGHVKPAHRQIWLPFRRLRGDPAGKKMFHSLRAEKELRNIRQGKSLFLSLSSCTIAMKMRPPPNNINNELPTVESCRPCNPACGVVSS